jgi:hypothetical protein
VLDTHHTPASSLLDSLPEPQVVRRHLGQMLREIGLLRRLLRLAESAAQVRETERQDQERARGR